MSDQTSGTAQAPLEPIGDPDDAAETGDFADEHDHTVVDPDEPDSGESESPDRYSGGLDGEGPP
jgi:hypothetical protein